MGDKQSAILGHKLAAGLGRQSLHRCNVLYSIKDKASVSSVHLLFPLVGDNRSIAAEVSSISLMKTELLMRGAAACPAIPKS